MASHTKVSESVICRSVFDRHDVLKNQVASLAASKFRNLDSNATEEFSRDLEALFSQATDGLVSSISKEFSVK